MDIFPKAIKQIEPYNFSDSEKSFETRGLFHPICYMTVSMIGPKKPNKNVNIVLSLIYFIVSYLYPILAARAMLNDQKN